jgi:hypothetical protein
VLSKCHNLRNLGEYGGDFGIDDRLVTDLISACRKVLAKVEALSSQAGS